MPADERLFTREFMQVGTAAMLFFFTFGAAAPVLPRFVEDLGGSDTMVGIVVASYAISAVLVRPALGRLGDTKGRRSLLVLGGAIMSLGYVGHVLFSSIPIIIGCRMLVGVGQAAVLIGGTALAADIAPPSRRGEAASYVLVAFQLGVGTGPIIGEWLADTWSFDVAWAVCAVGGALSAAVGWSLPRRPVAGAGLARGPRRLLHPAGVPSGVVIGAAVGGASAYNVFLALLAEDIGLDNVGPVFLVQSMVVVVIRLAGARLPDRLGPVTGGVISLTLMSMALIGMGVWQTAVGIYLSTALLGVGSALLFPCLAIAAIRPTPERERAAALATFTLFIDAFAGVGAVSLGGVAALTSRGSAFVVGGTVTLSGLLLIAFVLRPYWDRAQHVVA